MPNTTTFNDSTQKNRRRFRPLRRTRERPDAAVAYSSALEATRRAEGNPARRSRMRRMAGVFAGLGAVAASVLLLRRVAETPRYRRMRRSFVKKPFGVPKRSWKKAGKQARKQITPAVRQARKTGKQIRRWAA